MHFPPPSVSFQSVPIYSQSLYSSPGAFVTDANIHNIFIRVINLLRFNYMALPFIMLVNQRMYIYMRTFHFLFFQKPSPEIFTTQTAVFYSGSTIPLFKSNLYYTFFLFTFLIVLFIQHHVQKKRITQLRICCWFLKRTPKYRFNVQQDCINKAVINHLCHRRLILKIRQQPVQTRLSTNNERGTLFNQKCTVFTNACLDRRPLDPPPIVQIELENSNLQETQ